MNGSSSYSTFLFTDIEGSTSMWERQPEQMATAIARHDALLDKAVRSHRGRVIKTTGDGIHATFADAMDALDAVIAMQISLADPAATAGLTLRVRCGLHAGDAQERDNDFFGGTINRTARIMNAGYGGQVLLSQAVADLRQAARRNVEGALAPEAEIGKGGSEGRIEIADKDDCVCGAGQQQQPGCGRNGHTSY